MATGNEATSQETTQVAENAAELDALLGGETGGGSSSEATQTEESAEETEASEVEEGSESEPTEEVGDEGAEEEPASESEEEATEEEADEESELSVGDSDRDYSDAFYAKYAKQLAQTKKIQLDPNDPAHRALLKEIIDRGEALKRQRAAVEAEESEEETSARTEEPTGPTKPTPEQIQTFIDNAAKVAKQRLVPQVSMRVATRLTKALWPDEALEITQEQADSITSALSEAFWMQLEDALPAIHGATRQFLSGDEVFGHVETVTIREQAFERLDAAVDKKTGNPVYPDLEKLATSGALKKAMKANPWIKDIQSGDGRNRVLNEAARIDAAYKIARGESVNPEVVSRAVATGKRQEADRNKKIAAGRTTPGKPTGGLGKKVPAGQRLVEDITGGGGSKFARAVANDIVRPKP